MTSIVLLDVMPGADGGLQLISHHHAWALCGGPSDKEHDMGPRVGECTLRMEKRRIYCQYKESLLTLQHHRQIF